MLRIVRVLFLAVCLCATSAQANDNGRWFEEFKQKANSKELYTFLYALPKGGDLHHHLSGSNFSEWWFAAAIDQEINGGYQYYTKTQIDNCIGHGQDSAKGNTYTLLFRNIQNSEYELLSECEKGEYKKLELLTDSEKSAWLNSIRLDRADEGRDEFFQAHWQRLNDIAANPNISSELLVKNMRSFAAEGGVYLETIESMRHFRRVDGSLFTDDEAAEFFRQRLQKNDAKATGVSVRMQEFVLRTLPNAEQELVKAYNFVNRNRDLFVAVNLVGREDADLSYPLRFLPTMRSLRKTTSGVNLSIHAGESSAPSDNIRDTLLLGAQRIGHGVNLIQDADTMMSLRHSDTMIEINLISNLLLGYVTDFGEHPFPEYLRTGIPVALSTDDRGMWDSNLTDEFYVAVKEFNLSWREIETLSENSLRYAFVENELKQKMIKDYRRRIKAFAERFKAKGMSSLADFEAVGHNFVCKRYEVCF